MLAGVRRRALDLAGGAANRGAGAGWVMPATSTNVLAGDVVRVRRRLVHRQHRREADVGALHDLAPLVTGLRPEDRGQPLLQRRPLGLVHLLAAGRPSAPRDR